MVQQQNADILDFPLADWELFLSIVGNFAGNSRLFSYNEQHIQLQSLPIFLLSDLNEGKRLTNMNGLTVWRNGARYYIQV